MATMILNPKGESPPVAEGSNTSVKGGRKLRRRKKEPAQYRIYKHLGGRNRMKGEEILEQLNYEDYLVYGLAETQLKDMNAPPYWAFIFGWDAIDVKGNGREADWEG